MTTVLSPSPLGHGLATDYKIRLLLVDDNPDNLISLEAMLHGVPVLATDWSGSTDIVSARTGCPVGYRLVRAHDPQGIYEYPKMSWADADEAAAAGMLASLCGSATDLGDKAREFALRSFGGETYVRSVESFFGAAVPILDLAVETFGNNGVLG